MKETKRGRDVSRLVALRAFPKRNRLAPGQGPGVLDAREASSTASLQPPWPSVVFPIICVCQSSVSGGGPGRHPAPPSTSIQPGPTRRGGRGLGGAFRPTLLLPLPKSKTPVLQSGPLSIQEGKANNNNNNNTHCAADHRSDAGRHRSRATHRSAGALPESGVQNTLFKGRSHEKKTKVTLKRSAHLLLNHRDELRFRLQSQQLRATTCADGRTSRSPCLFPVPLSAGGARVVVVVFEPQQRVALPVQMAGVMWKRPQFSAAIHPHKLQTAPCHVTAQLPHQIFMGPPGGA